MRLSAARFPRPARVRGAQPAHAGGAGGARGVVARDGGGARVPRGARGRASAGPVQLRGADRGRTSPGGRPQVAPAHLRRIRRDPLLPALGLLHHRPGRRRGSVPAGPVRLRGRLERQAVLGPPALRARSHRRPGLGRCLTDRQPVRLALRHRQARPAGAHALGQRADPRGAHRLREPGGRERRPALRRRLDAGGARRGGPGAGAAVPGGAPRRRPRGRPGGGGGPGRRPAAAPGRGRRSGRGRGVPRAGPGRARLRPQVWVPDRRGGALGGNRLGPHRLHRGRGPGARERARGGDALPLQLGSLPRGRGGAGPEPGDAVPGDLHRAHARRVHGPARARPGACRWATWPSRTCRRASAGRS